MSEEEIDREAVRLLDQLIGPDGSFAGLVAEMEAADEPDIRECAKLTVQNFGDRYGYSAAVPA